MDLIANITIMSEGHSEKESPLRTKEFPAASNFQPKKHLGCKCPKWFSQLRITSVSGIILYIQSLHENHRKEIS